jgi:hypothetical protein
MSASLPNVATTDRYTDAATLVAAQSARVNLQVSSQPIRVQLGHGWPPIFLEPEFQLQPGLYSLDRACDAVRVRSASPGLAASVSIDASTKGELA